ncbi:trans-sulfuration enzyme family protein [Shouchella shacheensis]|uniref:trans-sulfuration enzyme family protein n=1 Tax=Shouchella shacheensis TaxID=1649580 RepID=UPI00074013A7|nr:PLP-dependent aspartate aminotransferase family protein [Shouchella shacheensis]
MTERYFNTKSVHFYSKDKAENKSKARPIYQTSAFVFEDLEDMEQYFTGEKPYLYSRYGNPNTDDLGKGVALLEEAEDGIATSSGMSAILAGVFAVCKSGDHIVAAVDVYGGTYQLFASELAKYGVETSFVNMNGNWTEAIRENTALIYTESITNPLVRVEELEAITQEAKERKIAVMVDNTFATPYLLQPYSLGADLVIHSATKYIGGHSDVTAGVLVGSAELIAKARASMINAGSNLSPFEAWLACRGLKTLALRMERQSSNAQSLATALSEHPYVTQVYYPQGVSEKGNGAMLSVEFKEDVHIETFFASLDWIKIAPTLAGVETSVSYPLRTSHRSVPKEVREALGIGKQLVRVSVGVEDERDLVASFEAAIAKSL